MGFILRLLAPFLIRTLGRHLPSLAGLNRAEMERHRRRLISAVMFGVTGVFSLVASLLTAIIDAAVQFERHGAVEFNEVMWVATGLFALGVLTVMLAKSRLPSVSQLMSVTRRGSAPVANIKKTPRRPEYAH